MAHFTLLIFLELSNYSNYLNKNDFILRLSKSKNCKEYDNEEKCVFQLISNKKNEFINFFGEIIINLPGFMTIYKDKFFARLIEFLGDKNYVNDLKNKCYDISLNYKYIDEFDEKYLGNKRKREKIDDDEMFRYDKEMQLLLNDYPKGKEKEGGAQISIKKEKNIFSSNDIENIKKRKLEDINTYKNNNINNNNMNANVNKVIDMKNKACENINLNSNSNSNSNYMNNDSVNMNYFSEVKKEKKKNIKNMNNNEIKIKNEKKIERKKDKAESPRPFRYYSPVKSTYKDNLSLSLLKGKPKYIAVSDISSINNIISNENSFSIDELFISEISDISNKAASFGINSRFDRMPKINIQRKKRNLINTSSGCILGEIKEKLINKGLSTICKQNKINKLENEVRSEQTSLHNLVSNNFYGPENKILKSENSSNIQINKKETNDNMNINIDKEKMNKTNKIDENINNEIINEYGNGKNKTEKKKNNFVIENEIEFEMIEEKIQNRKESKENKKKAKTSRRNSIKKAKQYHKNKSHKIILDEKAKSKGTKDDYFIPPSPLIEVKKNNENIKLLNTLEFHYIIKKNEISIKKVVEIPYIIIIEKIGLNLPEIQGFLSKKRNKEKYLKIISEELTSSEREKTVIVEEDDENNNCVVLKNDDENKIIDEKKEKKEKRRIRDRKSKRSGYKGGKIRDEEKKVKNNNNGDRNIVREKEKGGEEVVENNKLTNISTIKSNWSNEEEAGNNLKSKNKIILQEKTYYEEDNTVNDNKKKNNYKNKNKEISNIEDNLTSVDVLNGFNYLYQQKSQ